MRKTQTWMQSNMQLNQWSNQHIKLSKSSLNKNFKHMDLPKETHTHTHTYTHNKSNQFYISKTSQDNFIFQKHFWSFCFLFFFAYFSFKHIMYGHIRERKEIPNDIWNSNFNMPKHTNVIDTALLLCRNIRVSFYDWRAIVVSNSGEMVITAFLSRFFSHSHQKEWYEC